MLYRVHLVMSRIRTHNFRVIGTNCIGSCKSNYHTIMTTTAPVGAMTLSCFIFVKLHCRSGKFMTSHRVWSWSNTTGATIEAGTASHPPLPEHLSSHQIFSVARVTLSLLFCVLFCRCLSFCPFFCCLSFDMRILITPLVSSNSSSFYIEIWIYITIFII